MGIVLALVMNPKDGKGVQMCTTRPMRNTSGILENLFDLKLGKFLMTI